MENERNTPKRASDPTDSRPLTDRRLLTRSEVSADGRAVFGTGDPQWEGSYRDR